MHDGTDGLSIRSSNGTSLQRGAWVDAVGFADVENFLPVLADAVFSEAPPPVHLISPKRFSYTELMDGVQHANYVTTHGKVLDRMLTPGASHSQVYDRR